jgi:hypothetical protein
MHDDGIFRVQFAREPVNLRFAGGTAVALLLRRADESTSVLKGGHERIESVKTLSTANLEKRGFSG